MHLPPSEFDKISIYMMSDVALKRKDKGHNLNHPETAAVLCAFVLEGAHEGRTVEDVMDGARNVF